MLDKKKYLVPKVCSRCLVVVCGVCGDEMGAWRIGVEMGCAVRRRYRTRDGDASRGARSRGDDGPGGGDGMTMTNADHPFPSFTPSLQLSDVTRLSSLDRPTRRVALTPIDMEIESLQFSISKHPSHPPLRNTYHPSPTHLGPATHRLIQDLTVGQFVYVIRKRIKLAPEKAIFIFVDDILPPTAALMSAIYEEHQ